MSYSRKLPSKSNLQLVKRSLPPRDQEFRRWIKAPPDMPSGRYKLACESAVKVTKWGKPTAELQFTVVDSEYMGVSLACWIPIDLRGGRLKPGCLYERVCEMAVEGELDDDLHPKLFVGKVFIGEVTYRKTDGKSRAREDETRKKEGTDYLRVTKLVSLAEL